MNKLNLVHKKGVSRFSSRLTKLLKLSLLVWVSGAVLSGCTSIGNDEYSCPGLPEGVKCMSARDVYAATNDGEIPRSVKKGEEKLVYEKQPRHGASSNSMMSQGEVVDNYVAPNLPNRPIPVRTPAQVMRIWVAPWEDKNGDLIVTGYIYTEIEPRRWVLGEGTSQDAPTLKPLQVIKKQKKSEAK